MNDRRNVTMGAVEKINTEMQKRPDDPYTEVIGHYIIDRCGLDADCEKKAAGEKKTLAGAMRAVQEAAKKKAVNGCAVLTPEAVFGEVDKYFGFPADELAQMRAMRGTGRVPAPEPAAQAAPAAVSLTLEDFL